MKLGRRELIGGGFALSAVALTACKPEAKQKTPDKTGVDFSSLKSLTKQAPEITATDHHKRIEKAQELMQTQGIKALVLEVGASLQYFTGIRWWRSERITAAIIPAKGLPVIITPHFEEPSIRESLKVGDDIRTWNEDENPFALMVEALRERGIDKGKIAIEDTVRFYAVDGLRAAAPQFEYINGTAVVWGCRMYKSDKELALMQIATDVTMAAYRFTYPRIKPGMKPSGIRMIMRGATEALGARNEFVLVLLNEASAYPHGSDTPQTAQEGGIVLMDCGANVNGYQSDISRTFVLGTASEKQRKIWNLVRDGQAKAFAAAQLGTAAGQIDDAVRKFYEAQGFGPGYRLPGLPHRTGHGIGLEGHEKVNFVHGETTPLKPGMCLSDEPGLYIPGQFGVRIEDCLHMTDKGPVWFSTPPKSLEDPIG